jgi:hypothetical protein
MEQFAPRVQNHLFSGGADPQAPIIEREFEPCGYLSVRVEFFKFDHPLALRAGTSLTHARLDRTGEYQVFGLPCSAPGFGPLSSHLPKLGSSASRDTRVII